MEEPTNTRESEPVGFERDDEFVSLYANNVLFERSIWDLKMIFGQLDQYQGKVRVEQHTAITIPWVQAKLMNHFLSVNLAMYESENGQIQIPSILLPQAPGSLTEGPGDNDPQADAQIQLIRKLHDQFIAGLK